MSITPDAAFLSDEDAASLKRSQLRDAGKVWHTIVRPTAESAAAFVNLAPAQQGGEASFASLPNGYVQVYYYL